MFITRETDYAFRIMRSLSDDKPKSVSAIVKTEYITTAIAYKVARKLEKGGLIRSIRGNAGGYMLARPASEISAYDIYKVMEPDLAINDCLKEGFECPHNTATHICKVHCALSNVQEHLFGELDSILLADIQD